VYSFKHLPNYFQISLIIIEFNNYVNNFTFKLNTTLTSVNLKKYINVVLMLL